MSTSHHRPVEYDGWKSQKAMIQSGLSYRAHSEVSRFLRFIPSLNGYSVAISGLTALNVRKRSDFDPFLWI